ncbi:MULTISPECIES: hypothetical protein [Paraburkholderia]|uniref:hypothetical protein n=1 Tax=Paraburkholderia TaxID=1822464 RepID=UPI0013A6EFFE|nr:MULTISPECIES: hypothetical protein [Paraburkholderia]MDH6150502.1 hypothetical protein [Paraburkholderia sp. WSM4179]
MKIPVKLFVLNRTEFLYALTSKRLAGNVEVENAQIIMRLDRYASAPGLLPTEWQHAPPSVPYCRLAKGAEIAPVAKGQTAA